MRARAGFSSAQRKNPGVPGFQGVRKKHPRGNLRQPHDSHPRESRNQKTVETHSYSLQLTPLAIECAQPAVQQQQQVQPKQVSVARQGWPKTDPAMPSHKFHVGETVTLIPSISRTMAGGIYQVIGNSPTMGLPGCRALRGVFDGASMGSGPIKVGDDLETIKNLKQQGR
jgi:hypothetical protein